MARLIHILWLALVLPLTAQYETIHAHMNNEGRIISLNLYHFSEKRLESKLSNGHKKLGDVMDRDGEIAGVSIGLPKNGHPNGVHLDVMNGKITLHDQATNTSVKVGPYLIKQGSITPKLDDKAHERRTFLLHDGQSRWILGYAPAMTRQQLAYTLHWILKNKKANFTNAVELTNGLQSGFWVNRGNDLHLYLKELNAPPSILSVKLPRQN